jgi:hypothetical protein
MSNVASVSLVSYSDGTWFDSLPCPITDWSIRDLLQPLQENSEVFPPYSSFTITLPFYTTSPVHHDIIK